jgi:predicted lipoprotein with Yx(FWY)xxD motif
MAGTARMGSAPRVGQARRDRRVRFVADGLAAAVVLTGVTVGVVNVSGAALAASSGKAKTIKVSTATVSHVGTVLTTASGMTLYRFTEDPKGKSVCTGACAKIWPPLTAVKGEHVQGPKGVKGLSLINVGHGHWQVAFHNVALYRFEGDMKKGQAHGQGVGHVWFAALKSGIPASTAAPVTTTTTPPSTSTTQASGGAVTPSTPSGSTSSGGQTTPATAPPAPAPTPTTTPVTSPPPPPTTTPTTQPPSTTTTMAGGYGY